jgi:hypothetical protein
MRIAYVFKAVFIQKFILPWAILFLIPLHLKKGYCKEKNLQNLIDIKPELKQLFKNGLNTLLNANRDISAEKNAATQNG